MLKEIKLEEVLQNLYEEKPVYMMLKLEKENAIEDLFGADGFYIEAEETEQLPELGGAEPEEEIPQFITATVPRKQPAEQKEKVIDKIMPLVSNKKVEITSEEGYKPWEWEQVEQMLKEGKTAADIANYYGMNYQTVWGRIKRKGLI